MSSVLVDRDRDVLVVTINRPEVRNAVDVPTAEALFHASRNTIETMGRAWPC
jgi:enoyl-CoA hydratase/carnithine racemase